jgi:hypothetical protein
MAAATLWPKATPGARALRLQFDATLAVEVDPGHPMG